MAPLHVPLQRICSVTDPQSFNNPAVLWAERTVWDHPVPHKRSVIATTAMRTNGVRPDLIPYRPEQTQESQRSMRVIHGLIRVRPGDIVVTAHSNGTTTFEMIYSSSPHPLGGMHNIFVQKMDMETVYLTGQFEVASNMLECAGVLRLRIKSYQQQARGRGLRPVYARRPKSHLDGAWREGLEPRPCKKKTSRVAW